MKRFKYQALLTLYPSERGGLSAALPRQSRCLVVRAHHHASRVSKLFSCVVTTRDDQPLCPGDAHVPVTMQLNGDDALEYFGPGEHFTLWLGGDVGHGVVSRRMFT